MTNNSISKEKSRGKFTMIVAAIAVLAVLGLLLSRLDGRIAIVAPGASTPTNTSAPTSPAEPTSTPRPTQTESPTAMTGPTPTLAQDAQARAFADPILQAIADAPPDVEDDFSSDSGNWSQGFSGKNSAQILEGVLRLTVVGAAGDTWMGSSHPAMTADDFAVQFDARATAMEFDSHFSILWRWLPVDNSSYQLALFPGLNGDWTLGGTGSGFAGNDFLDVANGNSDSIKLDEWFTVTIIGQGSRFVVLLENQPLAYFEDARRPSGRVVLGMNIFNGAATAEFDNVKYWNLDNVAGLP